MLFSKDISYGDAGVITSAGGVSSWNNNRSEMLEDTTISTRTIISDSIPSHPLGLKPSGNQYFASGPIARQSLGNFGLLPDEMILHFLEYLEPHSLKALGTTCRFLYAFCHLDELWKPLFLEWVTAPFLRTSVHLMMIACPNLNGMNDSTAQPFTQASRFDFDSHNGLKIKLTK